jgi:hypothetical protein
MLSGRTPRRPRASSTGQRSTTGSRRSRPSARPSSFTPSCACPIWAATTENQTYNGQPISCNYTKVGNPRACYPMKDLDADGTGPDAIWRKAVAEIGAHVHQNLPAGTAITWTLWDEIYRSTTLIDPSMLPAGTNEMSWEGTFAQLVRAYEDASCLLNGHTQHITATGETCDEVLASVGLKAPVAPGSLLLSPGGSGGTLGFSVVQQFLYCNAGAPFTSCTTGQAGRNAIDALNFEHYVFKSDPLEEALAYYVTSIRGILAKEDQGLAVYSSEGGYGSSYPADTEGPEKDSYIARYYLMLASEGVTYGVWYAYDEPAAGGLFDPSMGKLVGGATGWQTVYDWVVGSTATNPCANTQGSLYACGLTLADGKKALALWDSKGGACTATSCPTSPVTVPAGGYTTYEDVTGTTVNIDGTTVPVGLSPILLR